MSDNHSNYLVGLSPFNERGRARLCCLNINCNVDLSYAVKVDDYCWFVLLPASRDRNIGEKVSKKKWGKY